jgi:hypothetical protein
MGKVLMRDALDDSIVAALRFIQARPPEKGAWELCRIGWSLRVLLLVIAVGGLKMYRC